MSVLIKDMEKPKSCYEVIDDEYEYCPFVNTDDDCVLLLEKGICEAAWADQYSKCPLTEIPEPCEDAVSRRKLLNDLGELITAWEKYPVMVEQIKGVKTAIGYVKTIPSVAPKRKTGKWIDGQCLICGCDTPAYIIDWKWQKDMDANFCPICGADMRQREENK